MAVLCCGMLQWNPCHDVIRSPSADNSPRAVERTRTCGRFEFFASTVRTFDTYPLSVKRTEGDVCRDLFQKK